MAHPQGTLFSFQRLPDRARLLFLPLLVHAPFPGQSLLSTLAYTAFCFFRAPHPLSHALLHPLTCFLPNPLSLQMDPPPSFLPCAPCAWCS
jgi:hypothetical protein